MAGSGARHLHVERREGVTVIRMDRPPANAFSLELAEEFQSVVERGILDAASALVLTGTGAFFSGGLDLELVPSYSREEQHRLLGASNRLLEWLYACPVPLVAAVNGHAVAGAFVLMLAADYRVGPTGEAAFGLTEARVGIPFPAVPMIILESELAPEHLRYCALSARRFGPEEAMRRGALDELQPPEAVLDRAVEVARELASMPADGYRTIKRQVRAAAIARMREVVATGGDPMLRGWLSEEAPEAARSTLEDRAR